MVVYELALRSDRQPVIQRVDTEKPQVVTPGASCQPWAAVASCGELECTSDDTTACQLRPLAKSHAR